MDKTLTKCGCGGEAEVMFGSFSAMYHVNCKKCLIGTSGDNYYQSAVNTWNLAMSGLKPTLKEQRESLAAQYMDICETEAKK